MLTVKIWGTIIYMNQLVKLLTLKQLLTVLWILVANDDSEMIWLEGKILHCHVKQYHVFFYFLLFPADDIKSLSLGYLLTAPLHCHDQYFSKRTKQESGIISFVTLMVDNFDSIILVTEVVGQDWQAFFYYEFDKTYHLTNIYLNVSVVDIWLLKSDFEKFFYGLHHNVSSKYIWSVDYVMVCGLEQLGGWKCNFHGAGTSSPSH